jgi:sialate O-acetylesterase
MVLQHGVVTSLYGFSAFTSSEVTVTFNSQIFSSIADSNEANDGGYFWKVALPPMPASFTKYNINVTSSDNEVASLSNVVFGDVFLCSGQSNMQLGVPGNYYSVYSNILLVFIDNFYK